MYALWITAVISLFGSCSGQDETQWNYPYYILADYLNYLTSEIPKKESFNSKDGTYHFKYDTGYGPQSFRGETRNQYGHVKGYYGYVDSDGILRMTEYVADNMGYRAKTTVRFLVFNL